MKMQGRLLVSALTISASLSVAISSPGVISIWRVASLFAINIALLTGLRIVTGLSGLVSLAHLATAGVGAYAAALVALWRGAFGIDAILAGVLAGALASFVISVASLRLDETYYAFATVAASEILGNVFRGMTSLTGGPNGLSGVPKFQIFGHAMESASQYAWPCLLGAAFSFASLTLYERSRFGIALLGMSTEGSRVQCLGVNEQLLRIVSFSTGGALAGLAGALMAAVDGFVGPESFGAKGSIVLLCFMVIGGGMTSALGAVAAAFLASVGLEALRPLGEWQMLVVSGSAIALLVFDRHGSRD